MSSALSTGDGRGRVAELRWVGKLCFCVPCDRPGNMGSPCPVVVPALYSLHTPLSWWAFLKEAATPLSSKMLGVPLAVIELALCF